MSKIARLLDVQEDIFNQLASTRDNLLKLGEVKRNEKHVGRYLATAQQFWATFTDNDARLVEQKVAARPPYNKARQDAMEVFEAIQNTASRWCPALIPPEGFPSFALPECREEDPLDGNLLDIATGSTEHPLGPVLPPVDPPRPVKPSLNKTNPFELFQEGLVTAGMTSATGATSRPVNPSLAQETGYYPGGPSREAQGNRQQGKLDWTGETDESLSSDDENEDDPHDDNNRGETQGKNRGPRSRSPSRRDPDSIDQHMKKLVHILSKSESSRSYDRDVRTTDIPMFDGDIRQYKVFKDTFNAILRGSRMLPLQKLALLRSKLTGAALRTIEPLQMEAVNYEIAWQNLDQTFDNQRKIMERNMWVMRTLPRNLNDSNSLLSFRQSYIGARENLRSMESPFNVENEWVYIIMQQFDNTTRR
jgi:hypothetical protein